MAEDPKKLTRAHKIALGIISAACCCLIGISAFALAAPDALNQGNQAEATQQANSASTDYGNDVPQEGQSDEAADQDGNTQDEGDDASGNQSNSTENESSTQAAPAIKQAPPTTPRPTSRPATEAPQALLQAPPLLAPLRCRYPFPVAPPTDAFRAAPTPPSRRALPPTMPCAPPAFRLARRAASTGST